MSPVRHIARYAFLALIIATGTGCHGLIPGKLQAVAPVSDAPRAGNAYLLRGFIGVFSTGMDTLSGKLKKSGVNSMVFQDTQWASLAQTISQKYRNAPTTEPLILIGHSYGADDVVRIACELNRDNVPVDLLITLDPVTPPMIPPNVKQCVNIYQSNGVWDTLPWLRGVPVAASQPAGTALVNYNIRADRTDLLESGTDHFNIEKKKKVHQEVEKFVLNTCPPRNEWAMRNASPSIVRTDTAIPAAAKQPPSMLSTAGNPPVASGQRN